MKTIYFLMAYTTTFHFWGTADQWHVLLVTHEYEKLEQFKQLLLDNETKPMLEYVTGMEFTEQSSVQLSTQRGTTVVQPWTPTWALSQSLDSGTKLEQLVIASHTAGV